MAEPISSMGLRMLVCRCVRVEPCPPPGQPTGACRVLYKASGDRRARARRRAAVGRVTFSTTLQTKLDTPVVLLYLLPARGSSYGQAETVPQTLPRERARAADRYEFGLRPDHHHVSHRHVALSACFLQITIHNLLHALPSCGAGLFFAVAAKRLDQPHPIHDMQLAYWSRSTRRALAGQTRPTDRSPSHVMLHDHIECIAMRITSAVDFSFGASTMDAPTVRKHLRPLPIPDLSLTSARPMLSVRLAVITVSHICCRVQDGETILVQRSWCSLGKHRELVQRLLPRGRQTTPLLVKYRPVTATYLRIIVSASFRTLRLDEEGRR